MSYGHFILLEMGQNQQSPTQKSGKVNKVQGAGLSWVING